MTGELPSGPPRVTALRTGPADRRRWLILAVVGVAQLMVVLDATIVNIALPSARAWFSRAFVPPSCWLAGCSATAGLAAFPEIRPHCYLQRTSWARARLAGPCA
jgi:hypothetical protein